MFRCIVCARCDGVLYKAINTGEFYHQICSRFIPELCEETQEEDMSRNKIRRWRYKNSCKYCREKLCKSKAVIKCTNPKCKCFYHIPCAIQKGMIFSTPYQTEFFGITDEVTAIPFYCCGHNKKLAASYRNDVIYQRKESISTSSLLTAKEVSSNKDTTEADEEFNSPNTYNNDEYDMSFACSNALSINFDDMIGWNKDEIKDHNMINSTNVSPKDKIPFGFSYLDMDSENYDL